MVRYGPMVRVGKIVFGTLAGLMLLLAAATGISDFLISRANPPIGRFIETTSGKQHVLDVGPDQSAGPGAPAVVLVHGATANLNDMRVALVDRLRRRHRVLAVDRPGHGWSERTGGAADASPRRQASIVHEVLRKAGVARPVLVAHSWAGALGLAYALEHPDEMSGLVLLAPLARPWRSRLRRYAEAMDTPWLGTLMAHTAAMPVGLLQADRIVALAFAPQIPPADYAERASILLALRPAAVRANTQDLAGVGSFAAALNPRYPHITVPTVIMTGTADRLVRPRWQARAIAREVPHARLVVLPGVGHMLHHVQPARVVEAIEQLIEAGRGPGGPPTATPRP